MLYFRYIENTNRKHKSLLEEQSFKVEKGLDIHLRAAYSIPLRLRGFSSSIQSQWH